MKYPMGGDSTRRGGVSDVKTVRWTVFTIGVAQNKEPEACGTTHTPGDYVTATGTLNQQSGQSGTRRAAE